MISTNTSQSSTYSTMVSNALKVLGQICKKREEELTNVPADAIHEESDIENYSASSMLDCFYANRGLQTLLKMSNFNLNVFECLWTSFCTHLTEKLLLVEERKQKLHQKTSCLLSCVP